MFGAVLARRGGEAEPFGVYRMESKVCTMLSKAFTME